MGYFSGKNYWAVILGGSSGMGLAAARRLAREGMHLCVLHRDRRQQQRALEPVWAELRQQGVELQTHNLNALLADNRKRVVAALREQAGGRVRLLLHSIARGNLRRLAPEAGEAAGEARLAGPDDFALTLQAMATSYYEWAGSLFEAGLFAADARCLALTSEGSQRAWPHYAQVGTAKAALEALSRSMAREFGPHGIRSNLIQAGITDTPSLRLIPGQERLLEHARRRNPLGRLTRPADVANVIYLLCTDEASWINAAIVPVDGGEKIV
jgi:enoyl-[acyl-carrier protein] reductase I